MQEIDKNQTDGETSKKKNDEEKIPRPEEYKKK